LADSACLIESSPPQRGQGALDLAAPPRARDRQAPRARVTCARFTPAV